MDSRARGGPGLCGRGAGVFRHGWADTPEADRRFFLRAGLGLMAGTAALSAGLAALQHPPGPGGWNPDEVREWRDHVSAAPYAISRSRDLDGGEVRSALPSCPGKCGVAAQIGALAGERWWSPAACSSAAGIR